MTIGDKIPEVLGVDQDGREIKASDYRGRKIVLYSYPKAELEEALCSGTLSVDELTEKSKRLPLLKDELETKEMRWLELSEIEG